MPIFHYRGECNFTKLNTNYLRCAGSIIVWILDIFSNNFICILVLSNKLLLNWKKKVIFILYSNILSCFLWSHTRFQTNMFYHMITKTKNSIPQFFQYPNIIALSLPDYLPSTLYTIYRVLIQCMKHFVLNKSLIFFFYTELHVIFFLLDFVWIIMW